MVKADASDMVVPWVKVVNLLSELVVFRSYDFQVFLQKVIAVVMSVVPVDACFIYFYDRERKELTLVGSRRSEDAVLEAISMKTGEGISGWVVENERIVVLEREAYKDPRFKTFEELPEDAYEGFLSVPIVNESGVIGVVNLQSRLPYSFSHMQVETVGAVVKIISSAFEKIVWERKVGVLEGKLKERQVIEEAKGVLMEVRKLSERDAYHFLRREAMAKRKTMREIAEAVILVMK